MDSFYETVFIGGGISCLAAARKFRGDSILFERGERVGGLCRTEQVRGFSSGCRVFQRSTSRPSRRSSVKLVTL